MVFENSARRVALIALILSIPSAAAFASTMEQMAECHTLIEHAGPTAVVYDTDEVPPANQSAERHKNGSFVARVPVQLPGFIDPAVTTLTKHGVVMGPDSIYKAKFNPALFTVVDPTTQQESLAMIVRGEKNTGDPNWPRMSYPELAISNDGGKSYQMPLDRPLFVPTEWYEQGGGIEDPRVVTFPYQPYVDPKDQKSFDSAIVYTAYDKKTARSAFAVFNRNDPYNIRKIGLLFSDDEMKKNPLNPENPAWLKSAAILQYRHPETGKVVNLIAVGEGNSEHGGIMVLTSDTPFGWKWPEHQKPSVVTRPGKFDELLVESAFNPVMGILSPELQARTGLTKGIYLSLHGDSNPHGYQVGYRVLDPRNPAVVLEASDGPYLIPTERWETRDRTQGAQVDKVLFLSGGTRVGDVWHFTYGLGDRWIGHATAPVHPLLRTP